MVSAVGDDEDDNFALPMDLDPPKPTSAEALGDLFNQFALLLRRPIQIYSEEFTRAIFTPIRPGEEGNLSSKTLEKVRRIAVLLLIPAASVTASAIASTYMALNLAVATGISIGTLPITLALIGGVVGTIGDRIKPHPYTHLTGEAEETTTENPTLMTLNVSMLWGGIPTALDGLPAPQYRIEDLAALINSQDPDVIVLQEMAFNPALGLYQLITSDYAHFYMRIAPNPPLMESGLFLACKSEVLRAEVLFFPGQNGIKRCAFFIETPTAFYFTSHLEFGTDAEGRQMRRGQLQIITDKIAELRKESDKPCILMGDLNIDRFENNEEYSETIGNTNFYDPFLANQKETCTTILEARLKGTPDPEKKSELIDYILFDGNQDNFIFETKIVDTYSLENPYEESISDHKALVVELQKNEIIDPSIS